MVQSLTSFHKNPQIGLCPIGSPLGLRSESYYSNH